MYCVGGVCCVMNCDSMDDYTCLPNNEYSMDRMDMLSSVNTKSKIIMFEVTKYANSNGHIIYVL